VTVDAVTDLTAAEDPLIARKVEGTISVPCYITKHCAPGGSFSFNKRGLPRHLGNTTAKFFCNIPRSALDPRRRRRPGRRCTATACSARPTRSTPAT
jgi:hypothetical protein